MKCSTLLAVLLLALAAPCRLLAAVAPSNDDTIVVKMPNQATMTLYVKNKEQLRQMRTYKLDSLMVMLDGYIQKAEKAGQDSKSDQITMEFYPDKDHPGQKAPEQIRITVRNRAAGAGKGDQKTEERKIVVINGDDKKDGFNIRINTNDDDDDDHHDRDSLRHVKEKIKKEERANRIVRNDFTVDLGLNAFANRQTYSPGGVEQPYDLRALGSRYVSLNWHYTIRLGGKRSPLRLVTGPEFAFNNYMFDNNRRLVSTDSRVDIIREPVLSLQKSKLATTVVNLPLMFDLTFRDKQGHRNLRLGAGGFAGYLLEAHTKIKYDLEGDTQKDKDHGRFNLQDFQYGVQGHVGVRGLDLFVKYNLNELFRENRGPQVQSVAFGVTLM
ncbi:PorT family protein [Hymenobacter sp. BT175]|uniref:outer membrane beta-barrel protein n=1 Tax=Hymenobacter translucens TaxID=2886507 RepID=UPI001D0EE62D|nr:outer membrane beta-barrel protein [Hymenobacter translucens]MCC2544815.1 PorT family protein [Hymenobacter translucens]